ncbi:hypothetical protein EVAR_97560_1 [Eumeta japonica]|uniref:Uncharacterized protein n=1 Tax=Eumeta variegata TaxID=151549 RepID=A0A4C1WS64_EUMVA|nr:hypothetical protein EVAR_97560_1 [Eumeta japonica]
MKRAASKGILLSQTMRVQSPELNGSMASLRTIRREDYGHPSHLTPSSYSRIAAQPPRVSPERAPATAAATTNTTIVPIALVPWSRAEHALFSQGLCPLDRAIWTKTSCGAYTTQKANWRSPVLLSRPSAAGPARSSVTDAKNLVKPRHIATARYDTYATEVNTTL